MRRAFHTAPRTAGLTTVVARKRVFAGPRISIMVPGDALQESLLINGSLWPCRKFIRPFTGGHIALFAYSVDGRRDLRWQTITAEALLYQETHSDRRSFLALHLVETSAEPTHRLVVLQGETIPDRYKESGCVRFSAIDPVRGWVVFKVI